MQNVISYLLTFPLLMLTLFALGRDLIGTVDTLTGSSAMLHARSLDRADTRIAGPIGLSVSDSSSFEMTIANTGNVTLGKFDDWDVIVEVQESPGLSVDYLKYTANATTSANQWAIEGIYEDASADPKVNETRDPGVLNVGEEMIVVVRLGTSVVANTTDRITFVTPNGIVSKVIFDVVPPPSFDGASSDVQVGTSMTWSHTVGSGVDQILIVGLSTDTTVVNSVTYGGQALTLIGSQDDPGGSSRVELWYLLAPPTGTNDIVATFADTTRAIGGATSWSGVNQTTPLGTAVFASGSDGSATVTVTSSVGEVVVDALSANGNTATPGTGQTQRWNLNQGGLTGAGSSKDGAAAVTMSWTVTDNWAIGAVPLKATSP